MLRVTARYMGAVLVRSLPWSTTTLLAQPGLVRDDMLGGVHADAGEIRRPGARFSRNTRSRAFRRSRFPRARKDIRHAPGKGRPSGAQARARPAAAARGNKWRPVRANPGFMGSKGM